MVMDLEKPSSSGVLPDPNGTWLISFADLLVLLLCAFIMYFSQNQEAGHQLQQEPGTKVAPVVVSQPVERLEFFTNDISEKGGFLTDERIKVVKKAVDLGFYRGEVVTLSICNGSKANQIASKFLTLFREAMVPEQRLSVRFFGTACRSLGFQDNAKGALVAKVEILNNG
jgi:hypothetical protein